MRIVSLKDISSKTICGQRPEDLPEIMDYLSKVHPLQDRYTVAQARVIWRQTMMYMGAIYRLLGDNISDMKILDLGCGSTGNSYDATNVDALRYQPWLSRFLHKSNAHVTGIDVGDLVYEEFEHYTMDLLQPNSLDIFPDRSIDLALAMKLFSSPELGRRIMCKVDLEGSQEAAQRLKSVLLPQLERVLVCNGTLVHYDWWDY